MSFQDNPAWWGGEGRSDDRLTLLDLVRNNTLDLTLASLLWLMVERKASVVAAAGPQLAGKTTLLSAVLDFMPPEYEGVLTTGSSEKFSFLDHKEPSATYILVPELSDHTPAYLWGDNVRTLFDALGRGYSMAATIHADTPEQVIDMLSDAPVLVPGHLLHHAQFVVNLSLSYGDRGMERRVGLVSAVLPGDRTGRTAPGIVSVAQWRPETDTFALENSDSARRALAGSLRMSPAEIEPDLAERGKVLRSWMDATPTAAELRLAVADHYRSRGRR